MLEKGKPLTLNTNGLRVLVNAGGAGIGRAISEAFLNSGAQVHITDINQEAVNGFLDDFPQVKASVGDASKKEDVDQVYQDVMERFGGLDVLVNNVGIAGPTCGVEEMDEDAMEKTIDVNLKGQFYYLKRFTPLLKASTRNPSIIAMSSVAGRLGYSYRTPYAATKWGVVGLTKSLAQELGPFGVRANSILPGPVNGERIDRVIADRANVIGATFDEVRDEFNKKASLRRMVDAEDIAGLAVFLASDLARNITGQIISVDGNVEYL